MRFPMTLDGFTRSITVGSLALVGLMLPLQYFVVLQQVPSNWFKALAVGALAAVALVLLWTVALGVLRWPLEGALRPVSLTRDPTDLIALPILIVPWLLAKRRSAASLHDVAENPGHR